MAAQGRRNFIFFKVAFLQPLMRKGLVYVACEIPREHCVSVFTNIRKIELKNRCHSIQVYAWVHQFPLRFTPVKGLSLTILALKWFGNYGIKKVKGCLQSTWWERFLCVLCGQLCCCVFMLQWLEQGGKIQMLLMGCHYYPKSLKSN